MFQLDIELDNDAAAVLVDLAKRDLSVQAALIKIIETADRFDKAASDCEPVTAVGMTLSGMVLSKVVFHILDADTMTMTTERFSTDYSVPYIAADGSVQDLLR